MAGAPSPTATNVKQGVVELLGLADRVSALSRLIEENMSAVDEALGTVGVLKAMPARAAATTGANGSAEDAMDELIGENQQLHEVLDLIMIKHRSQISDLRTSAARASSEVERALFEERGLNASLRDENVRLREKILEMVTVMRSAAGDDDREEAERDTVEKSLRNENAELRKLLAISDDDLAGEFQMDERES